MNEDDVFERFRIGIPVVAFGTSTGVSRGVTRNTIGRLRVLVEWDGSGITAETHPSQIQPVMKTEATQ